MKYELKHKVFFDEATHSYWPNEAKYKEFYGKYEKYKENKEDKGETPLPLKDYFNMQGKRNGKLTSTTQLISRVFPFNGGDDTITKAWLTKIKNKGTLTEEELNSLIISVDTIRTVLDADMTLAQELGTEAHEMIQELIEAVVKRTSHYGVGGNIYFEAFAKEIDKELKDSPLKQLIYDIEELLPCEEPVAYYDKLQDKHLFTGMWDGLYKMKNGEFVLIDIKTGSPVSGDKKLKVGHQMNAYNCLIQNNLDIQVTRHICIEISQSYKNGEWNENVKLHEFKPNPARFFTLLQKHTELEKEKQEV